MEPPKLKNATVVDRSGVGWSENSPGHVCLNNYNCFLNALGESIVFTHPNRQSSIRSYVLTSELFENAL